MKLVSFGPRGKERPGVLSGADILPIAGVEDVAELIDTWGQHDLTSGSPIPAREVRLGAPLTRPGKIIGVGANYRAADGSTPDLPADPILFFKPWSSIVGPHDPVMLPYEAARVVSEPELVVVIGKGGHRIAEGDAMGHVFGYMIANDVTAPEIMLGESSRSPLFFQQGRGKGFPTFCPLGPWIVTIDEVPDPFALALEMDLNGETLLRGKADLMIHSIAKLISDASHAFGLDSGDIILTGSPRPESPAGRKSLSGGDMMISRISGLGELCNPIIAEDPPTGKPRNGPSQVSAY